MTFGLPTLGPLAVTIGTPLDVIILMTKNIFLLVKIIYYGNDKIK